MRGAAGQGQPNAVLAMAPGKVARSRARTVSWLPIPPSIVCSVAQMASSCPSAYVAHAEGGMMRMAWQRTKTLATRRFVDLEASASGQGTTALNATFPFAPDRRPAPQSPARQRHAVLACSRTSHFFSRTHVASGLGSCRSRPPPLSIRSACRYVVRHDTFGCSVHPHTEPHARRNAAPGQRPMVRPCATQRWFSTF